MTPEPRREPDPAELQLLADQLTRMRGMLPGYSERFFERIRTWTLGYLHFHTVFARRHAEDQERAIDERLGLDVLVAVSTC